MSQAGPSVAVVTGAAGGIGAAISRRLAADGFAVACVDVRERPDVEAPLRGYAADVRDAASVRAAAARIRDDLGEPWLLVNAAGVFSIQPAARPGRAGVGQDPRHEPEGAVPDLQGVPARDDLRPGWLHREHRVDRRRTGRQAARGVLRVQGRAGAAHQEPGHRPRSRRGARELCLPWPDRHRDGRLDQARRSRHGRRSAPGRRPAGSARPTRSPPPSPSSPRRTRATCRGRW